MLACPGSDHHLRPGAPRGECQCRWLVSCFRRLLPTLQSTRFVQEDTPLRDTFRPSRSLGFVGIGAKSSAIGSLVSECDVRWHRCCQTSASRSCCCHEPIVRLRRNSRSQYSSAERLRFWSSSRLPFRLWEVVRHAFFGRSLAVLLALGRRSRPGLAWSKKVCVCAKRTV